MKKKLISLFLSAAMCMSLLVGCGGTGKETGGQTAENVADIQNEQEAAADTQTDNQAAGETASGEKITLQFWNVFTGSDGDILREIVDNYNKTNTDNIEIQMDIMPNDQLQQKLPAAIATNTAPDFVLFGVENIAPYVSNDSLEDISDFWDVTGVDKSNILENVLELSHVDGKLYGAPMQYNVSYLYWNKDLFREAGLDPEKHLPPWMNWQSMRCN